MATLTTKLELQVNLDDLLNPSTAIEDLQFSDVETTFYDVFQDVFHKAIDLQPNQPLTYSSRDFDGMTPRPVPHNLRHLHDAFPGPKTHEYDQMVIERTHPVIPSLGSFLTINGAGEADIRTDGILLVQLRHVIWHEGIPIMLYAFMSIWDSARGVLTMARLWTPPMAGLPTRGVPIDSHLPGLAARLTISERLHAHVAANAVLDANTSGFTSLFYDAVNNN